MKIFFKVCGKLFFIFVTLCLILPGNAFAKKIIFSFAPKDGTTFIQKLSTTREKQIGPAGTQIDESLSETKITCKKTEEGWDINAQPINSIMKRNGHEVNNPIIGLLSKITITYKLDKQGVLKDIIGYEKVWEALNSQFFPEIAKKLAPMLNSETLKQREIAEWNERIGDYLSKEISIGDVWEYEVPFTLPI